MPFETFERTTAHKKTRRPSATITADGALVFNAAAAAALEGAEAVELLWDADARTVGVRPVDPEAPNGYALAKGGARSASRTVSLRRFAKHYGIDTSIARRYPVIVEGGVHCIKLDGPAQPVSSNRANTGSPHLPEV